MGDIKESLEGKFMSTVKVGPKGQIVIPKEARDLFQIEPGDVLLLMADVNRGIALHRYDKMAHVVEKAIEDANAKQ